MLIIFFQLLVVAERRINSCFSNTLKSAYWILVFFDQFFVLFKKIIKFFSNFLLFLVNLLSFFSERWVVLCCFIMKMMSFIPCQTLIKLFLFFLFYFIFENIIYSSFFYSFLSNLKEYFYNFWTFSVVNLFVSGLLLCKI